MFEHLCSHSGQVMLTRGQIAERGGIRPQRLGETMYELMKFNTIVTQTGAWKPSGNQASWCTS
jgi:hypothetical protein